VKRVAFALVATLVAMTVLASCSAPSSSSSSSQGPIKIGFLYPITGVFAAPGQYMKEGLELFLAQNHNELAGRKVQVIQADTHGDPATAVTQARRLVEQKDVDVLFGPLTAAEGSALMPFLSSQSVAAIYPIASTDDLTQKTISPYIARTGWSSSQTTHVLGDYAYKTLGYRKVATVAYDFSFGWESIGGFAQTFQDDGGSCLQQQWPPIGTPDYSPFITHLPRGLDAVMVSFSGSDSIHFFHQYADLGGSTPLIAQGNATDESTLAQTGRSALGTVTALHYSAALDTPANKRFVSAYMAKFDHGPSYYAEGTYTAGAIFKAALDKLNGNISDPKKLVETIHSVSVDAPRGPVSFDKYGNPVENVYIRKVQMVDGELQNTVIKTYPHVSQFWHYDPAQYLKQPTYTRSFPGCKG
jgi:branched-chain amino acid transport system substrate-binding protein